MPTVKSQPRYDKSRNLPNRPAFTPGPTLPLYGSTAMNAASATKVIAVVMNSHLRIGRQA